MWISNILSQSPNSKQYKTRISGKMCFIFVFLHLICKVMWIDTLASASLQRNWSKKNAALVDSAWKSCTNFQFLEINDCLFPRSCTVFKSPIQFIHSNYFWLKVNCLISLWYLAVPNTISPLRPKCLEHDIWISSKDIIYLASVLYFLTAIFWFPKHIWSKNYLLSAFTYILSQQ